MRGRNPRGASFRWHALPFGIPTDGGRSRLLDSRPPPQGSAKVAGDAGFVEQHNPTQQGAVDRHLGDDNRRHWAQAENLSANAAGPKEYWPRVAPNSLIVASCSAAGAELQVASRVAWWARAFVPLRTAYRRTAYRRWPVHWGEQNSSRVVCFRGDCYSLRPFLARPAPRCVFTPALPGLGLRRLIPTRLPRKRPL